MARFFYGLQVRLVMGFTIVLALALAGVSLFVGYAAEKEVARFEQSQEDARTARLQQVIDRFYANRGDPAQLQAVLEQAGPLAGRRIIVRGLNGEVLGDSHLRFDVRRDRTIRESGLVPVMVAGQQVGSFSVAPDTGPEGIPEPAVASLVSTVNQSLLWTGLAAAALGTLLVSLLSRRLLAPVKNLGNAAQHLGQGDFSTRVPTEGTSELRQLALTFNSMAANLEDVERQRRNLVADVAHELRTPVSNIQGYLEAVKDGLLQPDEGTIDTIHGQVIHLGHLVEDLRLLAQAEAGAMQLHRIPARMPTLLGNCVDAVRPRAEAKKITLSLEVDEAMPHIEMDGTRISQVVNNLLENAIRHTPDGGQVAVTAGVAGERMVRVAVADTGNGIPAEDLVRVFDRFFRSDPSRTRVSPAAADIALLESKLLAARVAHTDALEKLESISLTAPFDGFISVVSVSDGDQVGANAEIVEVVDPSVVEMDGIVDEIDILLLSVGLAASVTVDALPGQILLGSISEIAPAAISQQGVVTYPVRIRVQIPDNLELRDGLSAVADLVLEQQLNVLLVPQRAIFGTFDQPTVRLQTDSGIIDHPVVLGNSDDFWTEVRDGLQEGDRVVMQSSQAPTDIFGAFRQFRGVAGGGGNITIRGR